MTFIMLHSQTCKGFTVPLLAYLYMLLSIQYSHFFFG